MSDKTITLTPVTAAPADNSRDVTVTYTEFDKYTVGNMVPHDPQGGIEIVTVNTSPDGETFVVSRGK